MCFMSVTSYLLAQSAVTGKVTDENGDGIPGANIIIKGTRTGSVTDFDGNYSLNASSGDVLVYSYVGYSTQDVTLGSQAEVNVQLSIDVASLDEIVVTGYGTQRRKEVTSAVTHVDGDDFNKGLNSSPMGLLQGKVAGLTISKPGSDPNDGYVIRLRGISTIGANAEPLVVIDGVAGGSLDAIDPNDIETIDVIKDGAAAAIYGTRGSSGVILITTKSGNPGDTRVDYSFSGSVDQVSSQINVMTADEYRALPGAVDMGGDTDWLDLVTDKGYTQVHNLAISGGSQSTTYRAAINYRSQEGVGINTGNDRINVNLNMTQKALNNKATFTLNLSNTNVERDFGFKQAFRYATIANPTMPIYDPSSQYGGYTERTIFDFFNPLSIAEQNINEGDDNIFLGSLRAEFDLSSIVEGLEGNLSYTKQITDVERGTYYKKTARFRGSDRNGLAVTDNQQYTFSLFEGSLGYSTNIEETNLSLLGGYSYQEFFNEGYHAEGGDFLTDAFTYHNLGAALDFANGLGNVYSWANSNKLIATFGRVNVNYDDTYMFNLDLRYEGSSKFGGNNKWALFYGAGAAVNLSNLMDNDEIDNLKLRVSYGKTGNTPGASYLSLQKFGPAGSFYYNGSYTSSYGPTSNANPDLAWEKASHINVGVDFAVMDSRLYGAVDYFVRNTKDQLLYVDVPVPPNLVNQTMVNIGETENSGFEAAINFAAVDNGSFTWTTGINFATSSSEVVSLSNEDFSFGGGLLYRASMGSPGQSAVSLIRVKEGEPMGQLWGPVQQGVNSDGTPDFADLNGDGSYCDCDDDRQVIGNGLPDFTLGWTNTMTFGNWDISMFWNGEFGHDLINTFRGFYENTEPTTVGNWNVVKTKYYDPNIKKAAVNSSHVEDATYFELNNLTVGYSIPTSGNVRNLRVYLSAQRPFVITGYEGVDPVARYGDRFDGSQGGSMGGFDPLAPGIERRNTYYRARTLTLGLNVTF